jgi:DNA replication protein DnaC
VVSAVAKAPKAASTTAPPVADPLPDLLTRLPLTAMRDRLDGLLDEAARRDLNLREALALLCEAEVAHRDQRRVQMGTSIAKFPAVRTLEGFDFAAQPSVDPKLVRDLAACRWVANGDALLIQGPPGVGKSHVSTAVPDPRPRGKSVGALCC